MAAQVICGLASPALTSADHGKRSSKVNVRQLGAVGHCGGGGRPLIGGADFRQCLISSNYLMVPWILLS